MKVLSRFYNGSERQLRELFTIYSSSNSIIAFFSTSFGRLAQSGVSGSAPFFFFGHEENHQQASKKYNPLPLVLRHLLRLHHCFTEESDGFPHLLACNNNNHDR